MWNLKYDINELIHKTEIHSQTYRLAVARGTGVGKCWIGSLGLADANYYTQNE